MRSCIVAPPWTITVMITMSDVVVSIACRASDTVFRMANAKDMAPRRPASQHQNNQVGGGPIQRKTRIHTLLPEKHTNDLGK